MGKNCFCCKKGIGVFSGENKILDDSNTIFCDKCFNHIGSFVRMLQYREDYNGLTEAYQELLGKIQTLTFPQEVIAIIQEESEILYNSRLEASERIGRMKEEMKTQEEARQRIEKNKEQFLNDMLITTGYSFEGYQITRYLGVISDGVVQGTGFLSELSADWNDFFGTESNTFAGKMIKCREAAMEKLKMQAIHKCANAIIGIDFDTMTFRNNMIGVMATGTAVYIEKEEL